jgi:RNA polymerase sigma factor (sigma-70 family)
VALRAGVRSADTDDFVQELWIWAQSKVDRFAAALVRGFKPETWLVGVAKWRALRFRRAYGTGERRLVSESLVGEVHEETRFSEAVDQLIWVEELAILDKAISALPAQRQAVVDLRRTGFSYAEIAHKLKITEATARSYYLHALRGLRRFLVR